MKRVQLLFPLFLLLAVLPLAGCSDGEESAPSSAPSVAEVWYCPMHPQIRRPDPGDCPICGMDLVPSTGGDETGPRQLSFSPAQVELARVETAPVERRIVSREVRMVGKIDFDETAVKTIAAWAAGRLERLFVDYNGVRVEAGDHLVSLYSPELFAAQEELLSARERLSATGGEASEFLAESNRRAYEAAREKLLLFGLGEEQVAEIEERGTAEDRVLVNSPSSGVVIEKLLDEGAYVETGTPIYRIAELDPLWVRLDAYEQDLAWLRLGQPVTIRVEALPGETFEGRITHIPPFLDERTRTTKVRVNLSNVGRRLKPGMFVRATARARLGAGGRVLDSHLAGKWVSPMHPEVVKDEPGDCDVCGMDLVRAEDLGWVDEQSGEEEAPLVVPTSAVLVTGRRAVVYVEVPDAERPTYEGREVTLGPRAGDEYVVMSGLAEGELVAVNGAFRIDSAMQIRAKPSMMSQPGETSAEEAARDARRLEPVLAPYLALQRALADDDVAAARAELAALMDALAEADAEADAEAEAAGDAHGGLHEALRSLRALPAAADVAELRTAFGAVSATVVPWAERADGALPRELDVVHCPMAFGDEGADWLQAAGEVANPYLGHEMLRCGTVERSLARGDVR